MCKHQKSCTHLLTEILGHFDQHSYSGPPTDTLQWQCCFLVPFVSVSPCCLTTVIFFVFPVVFKKKNIPPLITSELRYKEMTNDPVTRFASRPQHDTEHNGLCDDPLRIALWCIQHLHGQSSLKLTIRRRCLPGYQLRIFYCSGRHDA